MYKCTNCWKVYTMSLWKCNQCWEFGTIQEDNSIVSSENAKNWSTSSKKVVLPTKYDYKSKNQKSIFRYDFKSSSLNNIFWGWLTKWSVNYLSAEPGTWKSTMLWQLLWLLENSNLKILYYSWEENEFQIWERLKRIYEWNENYLNNIDVYFWESLEEFQGLIDRDRPDIVILDSLQKVKSIDKDWDTWSISQQSYCIDKITFYLKRSQITWFVIGHVNKEWDLAGSKKIEHIVDWVYVMSWQEGRTDSIRLLKCLKWRFWGTDSVVVMRMWEKWFTILDPEHAFKAFIEESWDGPWTVFSPTLEWNQLFLLEVQSLLTPMAFSFPKRVGERFSNKRLDMLIAIILKVTSFPLNEKDLFLNVIWPVWKNPISLDLAVVSSILSSVLWKNIKNYIFLWEVWLLGEIRTIPKQEEIIKKLLNMWYKEEQIISREKYKNILELLNWVFEVWKSKEKEV